MVRQDFGEDFVWGVSTAAFQIEGGHDADGKGASIWDVFTQKKGKIRQGHHARIACDFYHRYEADIQLMKDLHISNYRFSIAWARILPLGTGTINQAGIDFYNRVIDTCIKQGITPWVTLYHWDLPQALEEKGGWTNREIINWFTEFVTVCVQHFGDRIHHWMVMNEPVAFVGAGYFFGKHAPGRWGLRYFLPAVHHATLCMVQGAKTIRKWLPQAKIGTTFSHAVLEPISLKTKHLKALRRADAILNRLFLEPILGMGYPTDEIKALRGLKKYILPGDEERMVFHFDFIGLQTYTREVVQFSLLMPYVWANIVEPQKRGVHTVTAMNWEIHPPAMYEALKRLSSYHNIPPIIITENGAAFDDQVVAGKVHDIARQKYLEDHIQQVGKAKREGVQVEGYFVWTFTDNFEWAEGYLPRFGLVYVDFRTQERIVKDSGKWYAKWLS